MYYTGDSYKFTVKDLDIWHTNGFTLIIITLSYSSQVLNGYFVKVIPQPLLLLHIGQVSRSKRGLGLLIADRDFLLLTLGGSIRSGLERLLEVGNDIIDVLDTDGDSNEILINVRLIHTD